MSKTEKIYKRFLKVFNEKYSLLYDGKLKLKNYEELVTAHDSLASNDIIYNSFLRAFVAYRGDFIVSDRECVAFMLAFNELKK